MKLIFRKAAEGDVPSIEILIKQAIAEMEQNQIFQWDDLYPTREDFLEDIQNRQLFIGCIDCQIVVIFTINENFDKAYINGKWKNPEKSFYIIHRLCVHPKFQNKGIAKQAMGYIEQQVLLEGKQAVRLDVFSQNPYAIKLYLDCGYEKVGTAEWRKGIFYLMEKYLD